MPRRSYLTCPHLNMQSFTECCLDCGYNIYTSVKEYELDLEKQLNDKKKTDMAARKTERIKELERALGIKDV